MKKVTMKDMPKVPTPMTGGLMTGTQVYRQRIFQPGYSKNFLIVIARGQKLGAKLRRLA